jgi:hypothetical protein
MAGVVERGADREAPEHRHDAAAVKQWERIPEPITLPELEARHRHRRSVAHDRLM